VKGVKPLVFGPSTLLRIKLIKPFLSTFIKSYTNRQRYRPGVKGNSASNVFKSAVLENGLTVKVPLFIDKGESIRIDTRTWEYIERAK
jgi:hypothetical protein